MVATSLTRENNTTRTEAWNMAARPRDTATDIGGAASDNPNILHARCIRIRMDAETNVAHSTSRSTSLAALRIAFG